MHLITLINPPLAKNTTRTIPFGLWQLASYLSSKNIEVDILDLNAHHLDGCSREALIQKTLEVDSEFVGFTAMCNNFPIALELAKKKKESSPKSKIIFGGPHISLLNSELIDHFPFIDYIVVGEGEVSLFELLRTNSDDIEGVINKNHRHLKKRKLLPDLDDLPFLDFDLIDVHSYFGENSSNETFPILAGSGCPFSCSFCSTSLMWERKFRMKTPQRLVQEMEYIFEQTKINDFEIIHDIFTANKRYLTEFCRHVEDKGFTWNCSSRIDGLKNDQIQMMADAGCNGIFFGVESGSELIQKSIRKNLDVTGVNQVFKSCQQSGVDAVCSTIFGFPNETWQDIEKTFRLCLDAKKIGIGRANFHLLKSLPSTDVYKSQSLSQDFDQRDLEYAGIPYVSEWILETIRKYPEYFSYFYTIKNQAFTNNELYKLASLDEAIPAFFRSIEWLLNHYGNLKSLVSQLPYLNAETTHDQIHNLVEEISNRELSRIFKEDLIVHALTSINHDVKDVEKHSSWILYDPYIIKSKLYSIRADGSIDIYSLDADDLACYEKIRSLNQMYKADVGQNLLMNLFAVKQTKELNNEIHREEKGSFRKIG